MSPIKALVDLVTQLDKSVTDRRVRDIVLPIKEKALDVQREHLAIETQLFESQKLHAKEIDELKSQNAAEMLNLRERLAEYEDRKRILSRYTFDKSTGTYIRIQLNIDFAPNVYCKTRLSNHL
jgi:hypothetical protein